MTEIAQNMSAIKRLKKELAEIRKSPPVEVMVGPSDDTDMFNWEGLLNGPEDSPYSGGIFKFIVQFKNDYPMTPPTIRLTTKIFDPNISESGEICVDILKSDHWSSAFTLSKVMLSLSSLLTDPNPDSALNGTAGRMYITDRIRYTKTVKEWTKKYASPENLC